MRVSLVELAKAISLVEGRKPVEEESQLHCFVDSPEHSEEEVLLRLEGEFFLDDFLVSPTAFGHPVAPSQVLGHLVLKVLLHPAHRSACAFVVIPVFVFEAMVGVEERAPADEFGGCQVVPLCLSPLLRLDHPLLFVQPNHLHVHYHKELSNNMRDST